MVKKIRAYRRGERKNQVINQLKIWHQNGFAESATSYGLARALDIRASQKFRDILNEMVKDGDLEVIERLRLGRYPTKFYLLTEKHLITEKFHRRNISVKSKGVPVGQLEMWS